MNMFVMGGRIAAQTKYGDRARTIFHRLARAIGVRKVERLRDAANQSGTNRLQLVEFGHGSCTGHAPEG